MNINHLSIITISVLSLTAFDQLGNDAGHAIDHRAVSTNVDAPQLSSDHAAGLASPAKAMRAVMRNAKTRARNRAIGFVAKHDLHGAAVARHATPDAAALAKTYGISEEAVRLISSSPSARARAASQPISGGEVLFTARDGSTFELHRPLTMKSNSDEIRALVDIDGVVAAYPEAFRTETARMLGIDKSLLPENPATYDWADFSTPIREALRDGSQNEQLAHFQEWLTKHGKLESFLAEDAEFFDVFNPFHRYFVEEGIYKRMGIIPGAQQGLNKLSRHWDIGVVTKRYGRDPVTFGWSSIDVPADSAKWVADATNSGFDSITVMGNGKENFAGNVHAVFEDSVGNTEKIRARLASNKLREKAFALGIEPDNLNGYLAQNNTDVLGVNFRWNYNDNHVLTDAPNSIDISRWDDAVAVTSAFRELITNPEAGKGGTLHWQDVPGLDAQGFAPQSLSGSVRPGDDGLNPALTSAEPAPFAR